MIMETPDSNLSAQEFGKFVQRSTSLTMGKASWPLLAFVAISGIQTIRVGISSNYLWLGAGAIVAGVTTFFYGLISVQRAYGKPKQPWMGLAAVGGIAPYLYSLYVVGYWGIWSLREIGMSSFAWPIVKSGFFILLGYVFLKSYYHLTEIGRKVDGVISIGDKYQDDGTV